MAGVRKGSFAVGGQKTAVVQTGETAMVETMGMGERWFSCGCLSNGSGLAWMEVWTVGAAGRCQYGGLPNWPGLDWAGSLRPQA